MANNKYTDEELLEELKYFSEYLGRTPTARDMDKDDLTPCTYQYITHFGTWNNAIKSANLTINEAIKPTIKRNTLINSLKNLGSLLGRTPTVKDLENSSLTYSEPTYRKEFGSYINACVEAGLKPNCNQSHIGNKNISLSYNKEWLQEQNKNKTLYEISKSLGFKSESTISARFKELCIKPIRHNDSLKEKEWLDSLGITERQYPIENYKVDGYDPETNTVYEFLGDYWHGNPEVYDPNEYNEVVGKTFGQLFDETIERLEYIKSLGYNVITRWEKDFENSSN